MPYHSFIERHHPDHYRRAEVKALRQAIRARENRLIVTAPGIGVSNLLRFFVSRPLIIGWPTLFAYLHCDEFAGEMIAEKLFSEIARQFEAQGIAIQDGATDYTRARLMAEILRSEKYKRIVIVLDQTTNLWPFVDKLFFRRLKALTDRNKSICFVVTANAKDVDLIDPENLLFAHRELFVGPMSNEDFINAIGEEAERLETVFPLEIEETISWLTGHHPGLLRCVTSAWVLEGSQLNKEQLVGKLISRKDILFRCNKIWQALSSSQQDDLYHVYLGKWQETAVTRHPLHQLGLIKKDGNAWRLFSPLFAAFVATQSKPGTTIRLEISASDNIDGQSFVSAEKVFKGEEEVDITPLQLKLLVCLQQYGPIVPRKKMLNYIYHDEYVDEEDTRLDNLIRQVRQRIGVNHIKVHRGQGYEFIGVSKSST